MNSILRRRRALMGRSKKPLVDIVTSAFPRTYSLSQYDYSGISISEMIEGGTTYRVVLNATMPEGVRPAIAFGPGARNDLVYFDAGLNGEQTVIHTTPAGGTYTDNRIFQRSTGQGSATASFTVNSLAIYKL